MVSILTAEKLELLYGLAKEHFSEEKYKQFKNCRNLSRLTSFFDEPEITAAMNATEQERALWDKKLQELYAQVNEQKNVELRNKKFINALEKAYGKNLTLKYYSGYEACAMMAQKKPSWLEKKISVGFYDNSGSSLPEAWQILDKDGKEITRCFRNNGMLIIVTDYNDKAAWDRFLQIGTDSGRSSYVHSDYMKSWGRTNYPSGPLGRLAEEIDRLTKFNEGRERVGASKCGLCWPPDDEMEKIFKGKLDAANKIKEEFLYKMQHGFLTTPSVKATGKEIPGQTQTASTHDNAQHQSPSALGYIASEA